MTSLPTIPDEYREKAARLVYGLECYGISFELITEDAREEDIMSIARALVEEHQSQGWRDISTAPRDGKDILITTQGEGMLVCVGFYNESWGGEWSVWPGRAQMIPTHWMPLPSSPHPTHSAAAPLEAR